MYYIGLEVAWRYDNTGYILLGLVVEDVSRQSLSFVSTFSLRKTENHSLGQPQALPASPHFSRMLGLGGVVQFYRIVRQCSSVFAYLARVFRALLRVWQRLIDIWRVIGR